MILQLEMKKLEMQERRENEGQLELKLELAADARRDTREEKIRQLAARIITKQEAREAKEKKRGRTRE